MWYTTRYEGFDGPKSSTRGPTGVAILQGFLSGVLRTGFLLKVIGITGLFLSYYIYRGTGLFTYDLAATTEEQRSTYGFRCSLMIFSGTSLLGALYILFFQSILADDASWARGYRAGAKMLGNATFFDVVGSTLQFIIYVYMEHRYDKNWWNHFTSGGVEFLVYATARLMSAFALLYYASALFLLEVYHDNGTNDWHGILNCFLFTVAGGAEIVVLIFLNGSVAVVVTWVSLLSALVWAMAFEQEVNASAPLLNEPELSNAVEQQVEKFAKESPYIHQQV